MKVYFQIKYCVALSITEMDRLMPKEADEVVVEAEAALEEIIEAECTWTAGAGEAEVATALNEEDTAAVVANQSAIILEAATGNVQIFFEKYLD